MGTIKIEDVYADFENVKANNQNLRNENENLRNENQNLRYENQELERQIQYNKRMFKNDSLAMQKHIVDSWASEAAATQRWYFIRKDRKALQ